MLTNPQPTTPGKVSIVLLRGPSENVIPIDCLADSIPNTGTFSWTPSTSLTPDVTHYGLQIIVTGTGQFQYSTQFGISNPGFSSKSASIAPTTAARTSAVPASSAPAKTSGKPVTQISDGQLQVPTALPSVSSSASSAAISSAPVSSHAVIIPSLSPYPSANSTAISYKPTNTAPSASFSARPVYSSGTPNNATRLLPSKAMTVPQSLRTQTATKGVVAPSPTTSKSGSGAGTPTPVTANPNGAGKAFAAGGVLGAVGLVIALMM